MGRTNCFDRCVHPHRAFQGQDVGVPRLPALLDPPLAFAHRGAMAHSRENTLDAFETAIEMGATGLESDVWLTADGRVVLTHSGRSGRWFRTRRIAGLHRHHLPDHVPELGELFEVVGADVEISLDVKDPAAFDGIRSEAEAHGITARVWLCHGDLDELVRWRSAHDELRLVNSTRLAKIREGAEARAAALADIGIDALNLRQDEWTGGLTTLVHRFGRFAFGWDAQFDHQLDSLLDIGIDAVYSNHVDRMMAALARTGR